MLNLQKIKKLSEIKKIPLQEVAKRINTSAQALSRMMRENGTRVETLEKIAKVFNVPINYFFDEEQCDSQISEGNAVTITCNDIIIPREILAMLEEKDKQLREKDAIIARLTERLIGK